MGVLGRCEDRIKLVADILDLVSAGLGCSRRELCDEVEMVVHDSNHSVGNELLQLVL